MGKEFKNTGMHHFEGGWPKEIDPSDEDAKARFRRRVEKEENWYSKLKTLFNTTENAILQNNAINVYDHYFNDVIPSDLKEMPSAM
ncbi:dynein intermediate chain 3, ciliary-like [Leptopilina heterotoma]|uniref:dynein intermediate chain 3, ciliary-like n=1 Tax=Leptopilina heterotoma TaxID=63436 RepID=UPI001CA9C092|nr:dynein intermediate chain 3, ciliary-like [Leptopilina heterotoma]